MERLKDAICELVSVSEENSRSEDFERLDNAGAEIIDCLDELQAYRAIGTVKGYERAIEVSKENYNLYREYKALLREYEAIGTVEEFKTLKEKSVAKKKAGLYQNICPRCSDIVGYTSTYCGNCGQKLGWE